MTDTTLAAAPQALYRGGTPLPPSLAGCSVKILDDMPDYGAFSAELHVGGRLVGTLENRGNGGGSWFRHATRADADVWTRACEEFRPTAQQAWEEASAEIWRESNGGAGMSATQPLSDSLVAESLADALYGDAAIVRDLGRRRNILIRLDADDDRVARINRPYAAWSDEIAASMTRQTPDARSREVWVRGTGWVQF